MNRKLFCARILFGLAVAVVLSTALVVQAQEKSAPPAQQISHRHTLYRVRSVYLWWQLAGYGGNKPYP